MLSPVPITQDQRRAGLLLHLRRPGLTPEPKSKIRHCLRCKEVIHTGAESMGNKKAKYCTYCRRHTDHLNYLKFLIFLLVIITPGLTRAQGNLGSNSSPVVNRQGIPLGGVDIAVCQPVATTSASVTNNLATLTMAVNPQVYGYVAGMTIMISGFTGADSFLNAGTLTNGQIVGGQTILAVTSTSIVFTIGHIDTGTSSNGTVLQEGNGSYGCAGLSTVYSDPALTTPTTNPFTSDQLGNWNVFAASGIYDVQFYSPSTSPTVKIIGVSPTSLTGLPGLALNNLWTGNESHIGTETFANINKVVYADQQAGATADVKINACLSAISSGGTCNATGFGATTQSIAAPVTIAANQTLLCDPATVYQPATSATNMFFLQGNGHISGCYVSMSNLTTNTWTGSVIGLNTNYLNGQSTSIDNVFIDAHLQVTGGSGIYATATNINTQSVEFVHIHNVTIYGTNACIDFSASASGNINGNHLTDIVMDGCPNGWFLSATGVGGANITGNICSACSYQNNTTYGGGGSGEVFSGSGSAVINNNQFYGNIWDTTGTPPIDVLFANATQNMSIGRFDGTISDSTAANNYINLLAGDKIAQRGTLTLKTGSGGGNYTNATTSYTVADATNLCYTVTIPTGWKLGISASGGLGTSTAVVESDAALTDNAACSTANAGILIERAVFSNAAGNTDPFALNWVINGDGAAHNIALQFKTTNVADTANLVNSSASKTPTMTFTLMPSN